MCNHACFTVILRKYFEEDYYSEYTQKRNIEKKSIQISNNKKTHFSRFQIIHKRIEEKKLQEDVFKSGIC